MAARRTNREVCVAHQPYVEVDHAPVVADGDALVIAVETALGARRQDRRTNAVQCPGQLHVAPQVRVTRTTR